MRRRRLAKIVAVLSAVVVSAAGLAALSPAAQPKVMIAGHSDSTYKFKPKTLTVSKGTKVHWNWDSNDPHNVTFNALGKHSKTGSKESYSLKFRHKGTYHYVCTVHDFKGEIVVK